MAKSKSQNKKQHSLSLGIVVSQFNSEITSQMLEAAKKSAAENSAAISEIIPVPGAYDMPLPVKKLLKKKSIDAVVVLGAVVEGSTDHDKVIVNAISNAFIQLSLQFEKPIGFGIIGPKVSWQEAKERANGYAERAV